MSTPRSKIFIVVLLCYLSFSLRAATITTISIEDCNAMTKAGVMSPAAPVQCQRLREVQFSYVDFQGDHHSNGTIIVMDAVSPYIANIFERLYKLNFPINKALPIRHYQGDDSLSMADNNSSAFNYRAITSKQSLSIHAYGLAIDINPMQNPFIEFTAPGNASFSPESGAKYANRMQFRFAKDKRQGFAEDVVATFADNGFLYWGGFWNTPIDYQHFQVSRNMANLMSTMSADNATQFFDNYVQWYRMCKAMYPVAYSQHKVHDYVYYLEQHLGTNSLSASFIESPNRVIAVIQQPLQRSAICVNNK